MSDETKGILVAAGIVTIITIGINTIVFINVDGDTQKAKAGLQECVVSGLRVWKKECK